jgi:hypothetical protein
MTKRSTSVATIIALATLGVAPSAGAQTYFTFTLDSFKITHTRALHNDTDFVQIGVKVGSNAPITAPTKAMGDVNNGPVNLSISNVFVPAEETVDFSYSIVNTGYDANSRAGTKIGDDSCFIEGAHGCRRRGRNRRRLHRMWRGCGPTGKQLVYKSSREHPFSKLRWDGSGW